MNNSKHEHIMWECLNFLQANGIDTDDTMRKVIEFFFLIDHHVSFDDFRQFAKKYKLKISDVEIRDVLTLLVEYGFAIEKEFGDNIIRYEHLHPGEHHDHFYCLKCGTIIEFFSAQIESTQLDEARKYKFHPFSHKMQIHGLCDQCFGKSSSDTIPLAMIESGGKFRVVELNQNCGIDFKTHLMGIGITPGVEGEVVTNHGGRIVVFCNGSRIALGRGMSQKVRVTVVN